MFGCFEFYKDNDWLKIYFKSIPFKTDANVLIDVAYRFRPSYSQYLNDFFSEIEPITHDFMKSGAVDLRYYIYRIEDENPLAASLDMYDKVSESMLLRLVDPHGLDDFVYYYNISNSDKLERIAWVIKTHLLKNTEYVFDPNKAKKAIKQRLGVDMDLPAGPNGLAPDYTTVKDTIVNGKKVIYHVDEAPALVKIKYTSVRDKDFNIAFENMGIPRSEWEKINQDYVWHHLDDWDPVSGEGTMQLVLKDVHSTRVLGNSLNHTGGVAMWKWFYKINYR